jgi:DNA-binding PadR family transcriptional regulator
VSAHSLHLARGLAQQHDATVRVSQPPGQLFGTHAHVGMIPDRGTHTAAPPGAPPGATPGATPLIYCALCSKYTVMSDYLGEFEQLVLLALARLGDDAYGVTIRQTLVERAGRRASFGAIYSTIRRLEAKGLVRSFKGEPEAVRGGRAKKHVVLTARGRTAMKQSHAAIVRMADGVSDLRG